MRLDDVNVLRLGPKAAGIELTGEHDLSTKDELADLLQSLVEQHDLVVVDVSEASFIDSSVPHNLARADKLAKENGSHLLL